MESRTKRNVIGAVGGLAALAFIGAAGIASNYRLLDTRADAHLDQSFEFLRGEPKISGEDLIASTQYFQRIFTDVSKNGRIPYLVFVKDKVLDSYDVPQMMSNYIDKSQDWKFWDISNCTKAFF